MRGLDYYMRTTFEVVHGALGAQNSVLGGGRYDGLAEALGSKVPAPGIGFSIGEDRLVMSVEDAMQARRRSILFIAPLGERRCGMPARLRARSAAIGHSVEIGAGRQTEARHGAGQQAGRALHVDHRRQRNRRRPVRAEEHGNGRAGAA